MNKIFFLIIAILGTSNFVFSQTSITGQTTKNANPITTAVPFLTIVPESRGGAMGDIGVATAPDVSSIRYNIAKYPFIENDYGISISYTPWLRNLVSDINLLDISGYLKTDEKQAIAASLTYFSLGNIQFLDESGSFVRDYTPNEFSIKTGYSRLLTDNFSLGISLAYIYSNLTGGYSNSSAETSSGIAFASDIGLFYNNNITIDDKKANYALGLSINNIGNKMSYSEGAEKDFIPTTLLLGGALTLDLDDYNTIMGSLQFSKLLVPTPPIYYNTGEINDVLEDLKEKVVLTIEDNKILRKIINKKYLKIKLGKKIKDIKHYSFYSQRSIKKLSELSREKIKKAKMGKIIKPLYIKKPNITYSKKIK